MNNSPFDKHKQRLNEERFKHFGEPVILTTEYASYDTVCIADKNPEQFSPFEGEVAESIYKFTFKYDEVGDIPKNSLITLGYKQYRVDGQDLNDKRIRGHSEGDGSSIKVIGRPL